MNITAFLTYTFITAYTPGPNNIMTMTNAGKDGLKKTLPFLGGIFIGFLIVMAVCATFSITLLKLIPSIESIMLLIGAAYILFLAWKIWRDNPKGKDGIIRENSFLSGAFLQLVNIKIVLYGITAISSYVQPHYSDIKTISFFCLLLTAIAISGNFCWAVFGMAIESLFKRNRKLLNSIMAVLLIYCAVALFF